jgi:hypothetical protein
MRLNVICRRSFLVRYVREERFEFAIQLRASLLNIEDGSPQSEVTTFRRFSGNNRSFCPRNCGGAPERDTVASLGQVEDCQ